MPVTLGVQHRLKSSRRDGHHGGVTIPALTPPAGFTRTVRDVAVATGVAPSAVRFYEQHGLVTAHRTAGDQRRFDDNAACRIKVAKVAQRVGLTVREIAEVFADLPDDPQPADWERIAVVLIDEAEARTAALRAHLEEIRSGARLCEIDDRTEAPTPVTSRQQQGHPAAAESRPGRRASRQRIPVR
jgi:MerR family transcriptional regulator, redox-sensitive transcriptional activator SoxR